MKQKNKKSGFTLIELVVVIAIIGILAAVITPRIRMALYKARDAKAVAALDALRTASNVYFAEKGLALGNSGSALTSADIDKLLASGYIDDLTKTKLQASLGAGNEIFIEAGTVVADSENGCPSGSPSPIKPGKLTIEYTSDGVGLVFGGYNNTTGSAVTDIESTILDTACNPWNGK